MAAAPSSNLGEPGARAGSTPAARTDGEWCNSATRLTLNQETVTLVQVRLLLPQPLAFVAHLAERSPRKRQAGGSRPPEGSCVLVAQRQRHQPEMLANARSNRAEDTERRQRRDRW